MVKQNEKGKSLNIAIVLVEYQNQWTKPGLYHWIISRVLKQNNVIANTTKLVTRARKLGIPIIHAPLIIDPKNKKGLFAYLSQGLVFRKGTEAAELDERIYEKGDLIIEGRTAFDAFVNSTLKETLDKLSPDTVLFGGFVTDQCVGKTLKTALANNINGLLLSDCSATFAPIVQRITEKKFADSTVDSTYLDQFEVMRNTAANLK